MNGNWEGNESEMERGWTTIHESLSRTRIWIWMPPSLPLSIWYSRFYRNREELFYEKKKFSHKFPTQSRVSVFVLMSIQYALLFCDKFITFWIVQLWKPGRQFKASWSAEEYERNILRVGHLRRFSRENSFTNDSYLTGFRVHKGFPNILFLILESLVMSLILKWRNYLASVSIPWITLWSLKNLQKEKNFRVQEKWTRNLSTRVLLASDF